MVRETGKLSRKPGLMQVVVVAAGCTALLAGCGGGSSSNAAKLPTPPTSSTAGHRVAARSGRRAGRCHLVSKQAFNGKTFDTSKAVPCTHRHNAETAATRAVFGVSGVPDQATLQAYDGDCSPDTLNYLHLTQLPVARIGLVPVAAKSDAGKTVVRCDLVVPVRAGNTGLRLPFAVTTASLKKQARTHQQASWHLCTNHLGPSFALADCTKPHPLEALFHAITLQLTNDRYPADGPDGSAAGDAVCRRAVTSRPDAAHLAVHSHWQSREAWESAQRPPTLAGVCWFSRSDGKNLPPVH